MSAEDRRSTANAIFLCNACAALVDYDTEKYSVNTLLQWKERAERIALAALTSFQDTNWPRDIKAQCQLLLKACDEAVDINAKGNALEDLVDVLFTSDEGLATESKVRTGDEEIDLVCTNNVNRPFWLALNSPLIFVECKNWGKTVGAKEIRDFEIKLQNHGPFVKLGFFVSLNGFSSEVSSELKRMGRSGYHVVLIERDHIADYLKSGESVVLWLERRIAKLH